MLTIISLAQPKIFNCGDALQGWRIGRIGAQFDLRQDTSALRTRATAQAADSRQPGESGFEVRFGLKVPGRSEGESVPASTLVRELLWQHYGLDMSHPKVSRWLERRAPDVKYARAENRPSGGERDRFRVGPNGTIEVHLSLEVEDRLRDVSSQYFLRRARSRFSLFAKAIFGLS